MVRWDVRSILAFLGLQRSIVGLLVMVILVGMGEKMGERSRGLLGARSGCRNS